MSFSAYAVPQTINYQGKLTDPNGVSMDGYYIMKFYFYNAESDGNQLWNEQQDISVTNGVYNVELGKTATFSSNLFDNESLYLLVKVFSTSTGWETLSPRQPLTSTPFAIKAGDADTLDGYDSTDLAATNHTHNGEDITSGIIDETYIDQAITRDSELDTHKADPSVHHTKTTSFSEMTDIATDDQIPDDITVNYAMDADKVDGKHASEFGDGHSLDAVDGDPSDVLYVAANGNVGIGTMSPEAKFQVTGTKKYTYQFNYETTARIPLCAGDIDDQVLDAMRTVPIEAIGTTCWDRCFWGDLDRWHEFIVEDISGIGALTVLDNGNVGIGLTSPKAKLDILAPWGTYGIQAVTEGSDPALILDRQRVTGGNIAVFRAEGEAKVVIQDSGNLGIGTTSPETKLDVNGQIQISSTDSSELRKISMVRTDEDGKMHEWSFYHMNQAYRKNALQIWEYKDNDNSGEPCDSGNGDVCIPRLIIKEGGNVGIGTWDPAGKLDVNGTIFQRGSELHADYVFEPDYKLESIEDHAKFMWENKHLKAIPKAKVDKDGKEIIEVGAHRKGIVEELEKAHIYIEQLHKRISELSIRIEALESSN